MSDPVTSDAAPAAAAQEADTVDFRVEASSDDATLGQILLAHLTTLAISADLTKYKLAAALSAIGNGQPSQPRSNVRGLALF